MYAQNKTPCYLVPEEIPSTWIDDEVYLFSLETSTLRAPIGVIYMSKMFYPERFEDVDPDDVFRDYLNRFYGIEEIPEGILIYPYP